MNVQLGNIRVPLSPALDNAIQEQRETAIPTYPWPESLDQVQTHTSFRSQLFPEYHEAAKEGDLSAATLLVEGTIKQEKIDALVESNPSAIVLYIASDKPLEKSNRIPEALAAQFAQRGLQVQPAVKHKTAPHTNASKQDRLLTRSRFKVKIQPKQKYIIVDDHVTMGGTVRDLKDHVIHNGGSLEAVMTLTASAASRTLRPTQETLESISRDNVTAEQLKALGLGDNLEGFTDQELKEIHQEIARLSAHQTQQQQTNYKLEAIMAQQQAQPKEALYTYQYPTAESFKEIKLPEGVVEQDHEAHTVTYPHPLTRSEIKNSHLVPITEIKAIEGKTFLADFGDQSKLRGQKNMPYTVVGLLPNGKVQVEHPNTRKGCNQEIITRQMSPLNILDKIDRGEWTPDLSQKDDRPAYRAVYDEIIQSQSRNGYFGNTNPNDFTLSHSQATGMERLSESIYLSAARNTGKSDAEVTDSVEKYNQAQQVELTALYKAVLASVKSDLDVTVVETEDQEITTAQYNRLKDTITVPPIANASSPSASLSQLVTAAADAVMNPNRPDAVDVRANGGRSMTPAYQNIVSTFAAASVMVEMNAPYQISRPLDEAQTKKMLANAFLYQKVQRDVNAVVGVLRSKVVEPVLQASLAQEIEAAKQSYEQKEAQQQEQKPTVTEQQWLEYGRENHRRTFADALEKAMDSDSKVWLNESARPIPVLYTHVQQKEGSSSPLSPVSFENSPFNNIVLNIHADRLGFKDNSYVRFASAQAIDAEPPKGTKSAAYIWYPWERYVNMYNPEDRLKPKEYEALPDEEKAMYHRDYNSIRPITVSMYNLEQTPSNLSVDTTRADKLEDRDYLSAATKLADIYSDNILPIELSSGEPVAKYDTESDVVRMPPAASYADKSEYLQDMIRLTIKATGSSERLSREGMQENATQEQRDLEALIVELAAGGKMAELGFPAKVKETEALRRAIEQLRTNPQYILIVEKEVNRSVDMLNKAEKGKTIVPVTEQSLERIEKMRATMPKPQISVAENLVLTDIIAHRGMEIPQAGFKSDKDRAAFLDKFLLTQYDEKLQALSKMALPYQDKETGRTITPDPEIADAALTELYQIADRVEQIARELRSNIAPINGQVTEGINADLAEGKAAVVVIDNETSTADVILKSGARQGGAYMEQGKANQFRLSPYEVLPAHFRLENLQDSIKYNDPEAASKAELERQLKEKAGVMTVRFFEKNDTDLSYQPEDTYFVGKKVFQAMLPDGDVTITPKDVTTEVQKAQNVDFDKIELHTIPQPGEKAKNDYILEIKPSGSEQSIFARLSRTDREHFFAVVKDDTISKEAKAEMRRTLATQYLEMTHLTPSLNLSSVYPVKTEEHQYLADLAAKDSKVVKTYPQENKEGKKEWFISIHLPGQEPIARPIPTSSRSSNGQPDTRDWNAMVFGNKELRNEGRLALAAHVFKAEISAHLHPVQQQQHEQTESQSLRNPSQSRGR